MTTNTKLQRAARLSDLADDGMKRIELDGTPILLIRRGSAVHAYSADCPHAGAPLEQGALCDGRLVCPWHKGTFDVATGALVEPPALLPLTRYPVRIEHDDVLVGSTPEPSKTATATAADKRTFAIVGAGAAGAAACAALREAGFAGRIVLIDREPRTPYDRTVLSKFVPSGEMPVEDIPPLLPDDFFATHGIDRIQAEVTALDAKARRRFATTRRSSPRAASRSGCRCKAARRTTSSRASGCCAIATTRGASLKQQRRANTHSCSARASSDWRLRRRCASASCA